MYLYHFGLSELPFGLTPDTSFFCELEGHIEALNVLKVAIESGEGFIKITGEVGTGKTLLCRQLLNDYEQKFLCAYLPNPYLSPDELRISLATELGLKLSKRIDQFRLIERISRKLIQSHKSGKPVILLVDEAQALPDETLEALRLFTNLETEKRKLLQVVLFGQPELEARLAEKKLRQLRQRITFSYNLKPLNYEQTVNYVHHRINAAKIQKEEDANENVICFTKGAMKKIFQYSRGIPRLINILSHKSLLLAYGKNKYEIDKKTIYRAAKDTDDVSTSKFMKLFSNAALISVTVLSMIALGFLK